MQIKRIKIETAKLEAGMYVAQLDRPWLETPFLFQGFEIREDAELDQLRHYCRDVYIDVSKGSLPADRIEDVLNRREQSETPLATETRIPRANKSPLFRFLRLLAFVDPTGAISRRLDAPRVYQNIVSTRKESPAAAEAYRYTHEKIDGVLSSLRDGETLQLEEVQMAVTQIVDSVLRNPDALGWFLLLQQHDNYSYNHSIATAVWSAVVGRHLGFDRDNLEKLAMGGLLLDIGKTRIPEDILRKPGELNKYEYGLMQQHVEFGIDMATSSRGVSSEVLDMIACHHERHDGSGYPRGESGASIPVFGRIAGIVDCYDAMTSSQPHSPAKSAYQAIRELNSLVGTQFQAELVEQFVQALGMFPTGTIVELNTGEVGVV
ncbi:MAG: HD-GYP domain-containing protein, partial [Gammaproteobacteria bacterium]